MNIPVTPRLLAYLGLPLAGLAVGWLIWGANPTGRYQNTGEGMVFDTKTGDLIDPETGRTLREIQSAHRESEARQAMWTLVKSKPVGGDVTEERIKRDLVDMGHEIPDDFDAQFERAKEWLVAHEKETAKANADWEKSRAKIDADWKQKNDKEVMELIERSRQGRNAAAASK